MEFQEVLTQVREVVGGRLVYGQPYERNGTAVIPAARVRAGGGGGSGEGPDQQRGTGGGGGLDASPVGAWILEENGVRWEPAIDVVRVMRTAALLGFVGFLAVRFVFGRRAKKGDEEE